MMAREATAAWPWRRALLFAAIAVAVVAGGAAPWWGPRALASLAYFQVREIVVDGARYVSADTVAARLALRPGASVFDDLDALAPRVLAHGAIASARIERELPARLRVIITERTPVALAPSRRARPAGGRVLVPFDGGGGELPIEPARVAVDVPVIRSADSTVLRTLDRLQREAPALYRRVVSARALPDGSVAVSLDDLVVLAPREVPVARWLDIFPVLDDLARRGVRAREIDLRFARQVVARVATP